MSFADLVWSSIANIRFRMTSSRHAQTQPYAHIYKKMLAGIASQSSASSKRQRAHTHTPANVHTYDTFIYARSIFVVFDALFNFLR